MCNDSRLRINIEAGLEPSNSQIAIICYTTTKKYMQ